MSDDTFFGPIFLPHTLSEAAKSVLGRWLTTYLARIERDLGLPVESIPTIRSWKDSGNRIDKWPEDQLPALICVATQTNETPSVDQDGVYRGPWQLAIAVIDTAPDPDSVRFLTSVHGAAIRGCLLQHRTLEGFCEGLDYVSEAYDDDRLETANRTVGIVRLVFSVDIDGIVQRNIGPIGDPQDNPYTPYDDGPEITSHDVEVDPVDHT